MTMKQKQVKLKRKYLIILENTQEYNKLMAENFAARLELKADISNKTKLATKADTADFVKNKKVTSNKAKHAEAKKKLNDLTKNIAQKSGKEYNFLLGRNYFRGDDGSQNCLVFTPTLSSLTLNNNKKGTNWGSPEKIKPFYTSLEQIISNLANGREILKFSNKFFSKKLSNFSAKFFSLLYSNFI